ncbi:MAG: hypothetical protein ACOWWM_20925 [Desulfobacterales bacterium]
MGMHFLWAEDIPEIGKRMAGRKGTALIELCNLIADEGSKYAYQQKELFLDVVKEFTDKVISKGDGDFIFKIFSFLNWAYANGVWSNFSNTDLRRDLMKQSMISMVLKTAYELAKDKSDAGVAFLAASGLDQEFREYALRYTERIKELSEDGYEIDANSAILCGLEWIQDKLELTDDYMNDIVPQFNKRAGDIAKIEEIANQVNRGASQR